MSRTIPRAYVTAAWSKNRVDAEDQARKYCGELVKAGYLPLCPILAFSGIIAEDDPDGEKKRREMSEDLFRFEAFNSDPYHLGGRSGMWGLGRCSGKEVIL